MVRNTFPTTFTIFQAQKHPSTLVKGESCQMHPKRSQQITKNSEIKRIPGGAHNISSKDPTKHPSIHPSTTRLRGSYSAVTARSWEGRARHGTAGASAPRNERLFCVWTVLGGRGEDSFAAAMARTRDWRPCRVVKDRGRLERQRFWERRRVNINGYV